MALDVLRLAGQAAGIVLAAVAGVLAYGRFGVATDLPLPSAMEAERRTIQRRAGALHYYVAGTGAPLLLIHSINAAASAYEVSPLFERLRGERRVFAVDLPGFGFSERSDRAYDVALYVDALADMLDEIAAEAGPGPVDALVLSLSSEFLARLAAARPQAFRTLALVTPTGFDAGAERRRGAPGSTREVAGIGSFLRVSLWSVSLYNLLVTRPSIRYFLRKTFGSPAIDEGMFEYAYQTSHRPGARFAPYAFVSGKLFSADIRNVYEALVAPVLVMHGTKGDFQDFSGIGWARAKRNWTIVAYDTGALPQFERLDEMLETYRRFLSTPAN